jgi:hypothetical protein
MQRALRSFAMRSLVSWGRFEKFEIGLGFTCLGGVIGSMVYNTFTKHEKVTIKGLPWIISSLHFNFV